MNKSSIEDINTTILLHGEKLKIQMDSLITFNNDPQPHKSKEFLKLINNIYLSSLPGSNEFKTENEKDFALSVTNVLIKINAVEIYYSILNNLIENILGHDYCKEIDEDLYKSIFNIISIIQYYTDFSSKFAEEICECDKLLKLFHRIIVEFKESYLTKTISKSLESILGVCVAILYNTLLHDISENLIKMREMKFLEDIKDLQKCENADIKTAALLFTTFVATESEINLLKGDLKSIYYVIETLRNSINNESQRFEGFSSEELLKGLKQLSKNDDNKQLLVESGILSIMKSILEKDDIKLKASALSVLWSLAFDNKNKILIKNEFSALFDKLKSNLNATNDITIDSRHTHAQDQSFPKKGFLLKKDSVQQFGYSLKSNLNIVDENLKAEENCKKALNGLLWTLSEKTNEKTIDTFIGKPIEKHIMISYNWSDSEIVMKIYDQLIQKKYKVWIDKYNIMETENLMESMAQAVQNSSAVIICISHKYKNSKNCRAEAQYAKSTNKSLIPVIVQNKYRPDGWLGFCISGSLYCDFAGRYKFEESFDLLTKKIERVNIKDSNDTIKTEQEVDEIDHITPDSLNNLANCGSHNFRVNDWTDKDVKEWFRTIGIERFIWKEHYTGKELDFIRTLSKVPGEFFYNICKTELEITDLKDLRILFQNLQLL